jgi:uncharacterized protein YndB with AHSA1/START domain
MKNTGTLRVKTHADREIGLTRVFDAPRHLVFDAFTNLLKCWFGPRGWSLVVRDVKLKAGSLFRLVMCGPDGKDLGMRGVYRELTPPAGSAQGEFFDDYPGESQLTTVFEKQGGKTTMTATAFYPSKEVSGAAIHSGMEHGATQSYDKLAEMLPDSQAVA